VAAGLTLWNFYFRLYPGSIKQAQVLDFLQALVRHLRGPLLLVWDRLPGHRSRLVQDYIAGLQGWIHQEYLPAYAPELNPVEFIWAHWKQHELPNVCPQDYYQLSAAARRTLRRMRRRPPADHRLLAASFFVAGMTLYYARLNKSLYFACPCQFDDHVRVCCQGVTLRQSRRWFKAWLIIRCI